MASVGEITASLVAQTSRFTRPITQAQKQLEGFQKQADTVRKSLDSVARVGRNAGLALGALSGSIGLLVRNSAQMADSLSTVAGQTGLTIEQVQSLSFVAEQSGSSMRTLESGLRSFIRRTAEAARGNESYRKEFRRLGIEIVDAQGNLRDTHDLFIDVADRVAQLGSEAEASAALMNLMGNAGRQMVPMMRQGGAAIREMTREAEELGIVLSAREIAALADLGNELQAIGRQFQSAGATIAADFVPAVRVVVGWVQQGVTWFQDLSAEQRRQIVLWTAAAAAVLAAMVAFGVVAKVVSGVVAAFTAVTKGIGLVVGAFKSLGAIVAAVTSPISGTILTIIGVIALVVGAVMLAKKAWEENWFGIQEAVEKAWEVIGPIIDMAIEWGQKTLSTAWNWAVEAAGTFWEWITDTLWPFLTAAAETAWDWSLEAGGKLWTWMTETLWPFLSKAAETAWDWSLEAGGKLWEWGVDVLWPVLKDGAETAWNWSLKAAGAFWEWLTGPAADFVKGAATTTWNFLTGTVPDFIRKAIDWLGSAATTTWDFLTGTVPDFIRNVIDWFGSTAETTWNIATGTAESVIEFISNTIDRLTGTISTVWDWTVKGLEPVTKAFDTAKDVGGRAWQSFTGWLGFQRGGVLPGAGGADSIPAMLAPGEAVIPYDIWRQGLAAIAAWFRTLGVQGFQTGGIAGGNAGGGGSGGFLGDIPQTIMGSLQSVMAWIMEALGSVATFILGEERAEQFTDFFETLQKEIGRFVDALSGATDETEKASDRVGDEVEKQLSLWQRLVQRVSNAWDTAAAFVREQALEASEQLKNFGLDIARSLGPLGIVSSLLSALAGPVETLIYPITMVTAAIAEGLLPVFQATFPIVKFFGQMLLTVAEIVGSVWNSLLDLISLIPLVNLRKYKVDVDALSRASRDLADLTWEEAEARAHNTESLEQSTEALRNVPQVFRMALRTGQAAGVTALQTGGIVTRPTFAMLGEAGPEAVIPLDRMDEGRPQVQINISMSGPVYGMRDFEQQVQQALARVARRAGMAEHGLVVKMT